MVTAKALNKNVISSSLSCSVSCLSIWTVTTVQEQVHNLQYNGTEPLLLFYDPNLHGTNARTQKYNPLMYMSLSLFQFPQALFIRTQSHTRLETKPIIFWNVIVVNNNQEYCGLTCGTYPFRQENNANYFRFASLVTPRVQGFVSLQLPNDSP